MVFTQQEESDHPAEGTHEADVGEDEGEAGEAGLSVAEVAVDDGFVEAELVGDAGCSGEVFAWGTIWRTETNCKGDGLVGGGDFDTDDGEDLDCEESRRVATAKEIASRNWRGFAGSRFLH